MSEKTIVLCLSTQLYIQHQLEGRKVQMLINDQCVHSWWYLYKCTVFVFTLWQWWLRAAFQAPQ